MFEREKLLEWVKAELPKLLREDAEFRTLLLATLIQYLPTREEFTAILERLERIEHELVELRRDFAEMSRRLERVEQELVEVRRDYGARLEELRRDFHLMQQTIAEHQEAIRSLQQTIAEHQEAIRSLQQAVMAMLERFERVEARLDDVAAQQVTIVEEVRELCRGLSRLGIVSEEIVRSTLRTAVEEWLRAGTVTRMLLAGREVDVVIRDAEHILLEITARIHLQDIEKIKRSAEEYEQQSGVRPRLAVACAYVSPHVLRRLIEEGIEVIAVELPE